VLILAVMDLSVCVRTGGTARVSVRPLSGVVSVCLTDSMTTALTRTTNPLNRLESKSSVGLVGSL